MSITVNCFATLAQYAPSGGSMELSPGLTVGGLIEALSIPRERVKSVFVNGLHAEMDHLLAEGDRVGVFPAVAGG